MTKKTVETVDGVETEVVAQSEIATVAHEYNREDLNELRDRLNEVIAVVNNSLTK